MKKLLALVIIFLILLFVARGWWNSQLAAVSSDKQTIIFVVKKGEGLSEVTDDLKNQKLIRNPLVFSLYAKQSGLGGKIQAGTFRLSSQMTSREILKNLTSQPLDSWVTFLEGWRVEEMADVLSEKFKVQSEKFISKLENEDFKRSFQTSFIKFSKEGYMFPDTYLFPKDYSAEQIAKRLRDTFEAKYSDDLRSKIRAQDLTENQGVILASIVEREARSDQARTMVASILLKRFKIGMGLNADATIQYALGYQSVEKNWWKKHLTEEDKKINSPYNTYLYSDLPPTPICNPGLASLKAVAEADSSVPYLYYYHDSKGNSHYAKTLEEHNQNVTNYP